METKEIQSFRDLIVWQKSMDLVVLVYELTEKYPKHEIYGLTSQTRRSAVSIPSNISEGKLRGSRKDFRQFLIVAFASGAELDTQLEIGMRLNYLNQSEYRSAKDLLDEVTKMLNKFIHSLEVLP
jgi:four helix bundle protein